MKMILANHPSTADPIQVLSQTLGIKKTPFEKLQEAQAALGKSEWAPFASQEEWDLAQWLMKSVGQNSIDKFLKLPIVSSYKKSLKSIDISLFDIIDQRAQWPLIPQHVVLLEES